MKISVMFITYNRKIEFLRALKSCINQQIDDMEIVIVDNHSTDGTKDEAEKLLEKYAMKYKYFYADNNLGISAGRNKAFTMCEGEYVFCLDDDAILVSENFFEKLYTSMKMNKDVVAGAVCIYEPINDRYLKGLTFKTCSENVSFSYIGAAHVLKRDFFSNSELYPSQLRFGSEELYVAYKIYKNGKKMIYMDDLLVHHLPSAVARVKGDERDINIIVNNYIIRKMYYPIISFPVLQAFLFFRIIKHNYIRKGYISDIKRMLVERYCENNVDRMSMKQFICLINEMGLFYVF